MRDDDVLSNVIVKKELDLRDGKIVSAYIAQIQRAQAAIEVEEAIDIKVDAFEGLQRDMESWQRLTGHSLLACRRNCHHLFQGFKPCFCLHKGRIRPRCGGGCLDHNKKAPMLKLKSQLIA